MEVLEELVIESSCLSSAGYDPEQMLLQVVFKTDGSIHLYSDVPPEVWAGLQASDSKGYYFNSRIKNVYPEI